MVEHSCSRKIAHATKAEAERAARSAYGLTAARYVYLCRNCGAWHTSKEEPRARDVSDLPRSAAEPGGPRSALSERYLHLRATGLPAGDAARALARECDVDVGTIARTLIAADSRLQVELGALKDRSVARRAERLHSETESRDGSPTGPPQHASHFNREEDR
jgi:hypothetical protein